MARRSSWLTRNVLVLGLVSLLTDSSSEMIIPLLPVFVVGLPGGGALALGIIEGSAEAVAALLKLVSGIVADRRGRRAPLVVMGYTLSSAARPLVAVATGAWQVLAVRVVDRVGKGLRSTPRDALLASSVDGGHRGLAFGFHRSMDHAGAVLGPLLAVGALALWPGDLRRVFWLAAIPAALAVIALVTGLREPAAGATGARLDLRWRPGERRRLVRFLVPLGVFTLGNASDTFLLLKVGTTDAPLTTLPLLWMGLHVVKSAVSPLGGRLADRWGARRTLALGWLVYALVYAAFAMVTHPIAMATLFVAYGFFHGLSEAPEKTIVAGMVTEDRRGTAFGWYNLTIGALALPAGVLFGVVWERLGAPAAFWLGAALAAAALVLLGLASLPPRSR